MRIALVDSTPGAKFYPLALLKIGAWRKSLGDNCKIFNDRLPKAKEYDEIWITTTFTFDIPHALGIVRAAKERAPRVIVGGISATLLSDLFKKEGVEVHKGLLSEAEKFSPNYNLLEEKPKYSIAHTSRGCLRACGFCMVHKLEPKFMNRPNWERDINPATDKVLFYDNNWLAKNLTDLKQDITKLWKLKKTGRIKQIDFNQGLDARLMTEEIADLLKGLPIFPIRFAFDNMQEDGHYQRAVRMMAKRGFHGFMTYVLYNYKDTPEDFYYRLKESVLISADLRIAVDSFPMRYQPILEIDEKRKYVGRYWTVQKRKSVKAILGYYSGRAGTVTAHAYNTMPPIEEFEYWFGKDEKEFNKLLSYPRLRQLFKRKKGALRLVRAKAVKINGRK